MSKFVLTLFSTIVALGTQSALASKHEMALFDWSQAPKIYLAKVTDPTYAKACGSCHFAYQPGLLPPLSWELMLRQPEDHFGTKIQLSDTEMGTIRNYLLNNAAGRINAELSNQIMATYDAKRKSLRITDQALIQQKHAGIKLTDDVKSLAQCERCHQDAANANYRSSQP